MRSIAFVLPLIALTGCAGYQARYQAVGAEQHRQIDTQDDATCRSYGAAPGVSIDAERTHSDLSSALRLFVLNHYQEHSTERKEQSGAHAGNRSAPMPSSRVA